MIDVPENPNMVVSCLVFDKFDGEEMKNFIKNKMTPKVPKNAMKIVKRFGEDWYQTLSQEEWNEQQHDLYCVNKTKFNSKVDLENYMDDVSMIRLPYDKV